MKKIFKFIRKIFSFHEKKAKENIPEVISSPPEVKVSSSLPIKKETETEKEEEIETMSKKYTKPNPSPELKRKRIQQVFYWDARYFPFRWRTKLIRHL